MFSLTDEVKYYCWEIIVENYSLRNFPVPHCSGLYKQGNWWGFLDCKQKQTHWSANFQGLIARMCKVSKF